MKFREREKSKFGENITIRESEKNETSGTGRNPYSGAGEKGEGRKMKFRVPGKTGTGKNQNSRKVKNGDGTKSKFRERGKS